MEVHFMNILGCTFYRCHKFDHWDLNHGVLMGQRLDEMTLISTHKVIDATKLIILSTFDKVVCH